MRDRRSNEPASPLPRKPLIPFGGTFAPPPPLPAQRPGRGGSRAARACEMAQDGSTRAWKSPIWLPRSLKKPTWRQEAP
eukprot:582637-Pyramimonas_sp.AAC.1